MMVLARRPRFPRRGAGCPLAVALLALGLGLALALPLAAETSRLTHSVNLPPNTPPAPKGYQSAAEVIAAIGTGQVKMVATPKAVPEDVVAHTNLVYGAVNGRELSLDLYAPARRTRPVPALVFIHGGAWSGGNRDMYKYYTIRYAQRGYVAATISYRLSREAPFPAAVEDAKCAVRWLRAHAAEYGIDPDRMAALGGSAGGHLSMMVGYAATAKELEGTGGHPDVSSRVQAVVNIYGPWDLTTSFAQNAGAVKRFLGGKTWDEAPELYRQASPATYLKRGAPPTLILHGTLDDVVPIDQADTLAARLQELGVPFVYDRLEGWPHVMDAAEPVNERCQFLINAFLAEHLPLPK